MEHLLEFATERQREVIQKVIECGSARAASRELDLHHSTINEMIFRCKTKAAKAGVAPEAGLTHQTAAGFATKRVSTMYKDDGSVGLQWHIQEQDKQAQMDAIVKFCESFKWKPAPKIKHKGEEKSELCTLYTLTDYHMGMYAFKDIGGDNWDSKIATNTAITALAQMIEGSPDSSVGILNLQGDFLHYDSLEPKTPTSGHIVDSDSRMEALVDVSVHLIMHCIEMLLTKHKDLRVYICEGNHDIVSSLFLRKLVKHVYVDNKRVSVDDTSFPYYAYQHGKVMLGFHHGHKKKNTALPALFASEPRYRQMWGECTAGTYIHTGHYHHQEKDVHEDGGAVVERHPTLAARDSHAARGGYTSLRAAHAITYHKDRGEVSRCTVTPTSEQEAAA
jgi:hypothetical protein